MIQTQTEDINYLIQLSDNMANTKADLLSYIEYFYEKMLQEYEDAEFLVQSEEDLGKWIELWDGNPDEIGEANWKLREWKIGQHMVSKKEFVEMVLLDTKDALETVFQHRIGNRIMWELDKALGEDLMFEMLYERHLEMPSARVEYLI